MQAPLGVEAEPQLLISAELAIGGAVAEGSLFAPLSDEPAPAAGELYGGAEGEVLVWGAKRVRRSATPRLRRLLPGEDSPLPEHAEEAPVAAPGVSRLAEKLEVRTSEGN
jgi:hypothetical protein